jgi:transcriptional regulator with XRE-family HTH domain
MKQQGGVLRGPKESLAWRKHIGQQVATYRQAHGEAQVDLAAVLDVDRSYISHVERGQTSLTCEKVTLLCAHWGVSVDEFVGRQPQNSAQEAVDVTRFTSDAASLPRPAFLFLWEVQRLLQQFWH